MTDAETPVQDTRFATAEQFNKVLLRWMPQPLAAIPEGRLVAGILTQAWSDGDAWFFTPTCKWLQFWCAKIGVSAEFLADEFHKHNRAYAKKQGLL